MFRPPQLCAVWGRVALAATLLVAVPGVARAQFERASISGTVTDQQVVSCPVSRSPQSR